MKNKKGNQVRKVSAKATNVRKPSQIKVASVKTRPSNAMKRPSKPPQKKVPSKSLTKSTRRSSKLKIIAAIVGVLAIGSAIGLGVGLSSSSSSSSTLSKQSGLNTWKEAFDSLDSNDSVSSVVVSTPFVEVNDQPLTTDLIKEFNLDTKLPELTQNISVKYSHPALNSNGNLSLTLIVKEGNSDPIQKVLTLTIQGLDLVNAKNYFISNLQPKSLTRDDVISPLPTETSFTPTLAQEYFLDYTPQEGVTVTYSHEGLVEDGDLVLKFKIMENDSRTIATVEKGISVSGIDFGTAKTYFQGLTPIRLKRLSHILPVEKESFEASIGLLYFSNYQQPTGVEIKYSHNGLTEDGTLDINFVITKQNQSVSIAKSIEVYGINQGEAQTYLNALELQKKQFSDRSQVPPSSRGTLDSTTATQFFDFPSGESYNAPSGVTITYEIGVISSNNDFIVRFTITSNTSSTFSIPPFDITYKIGG